MRLVTAINILTRPNTLNFLLDYINQPLLEYINQWIVHTWIIVIKFPDYSITEKVAKWLKILLML